MRRLALLLLLFLTQVVVGRTTEPAPDLPTGKLDLQGIVISRVTTAEAPFKPVAGAEVRLEGTSKVTTTDAGGSFKFTGLMSGIYQVSTSKDGAQARATVHLSESAPSAACLVLTPAGTTMWGLTPLGMDTVYVALNQCQQGGPDPGPFLDPNSSPGTTLSYPAAVVNEWRDLLLERGELSPVDFGKQTPVTAALNSFMLLPPENPPFTGYQPLRFQPVWLAFRPDGKRLYAACSDQCIRFFDPAVLKPAGSIPTSDSIVTDLAVSNRYLAATLMSPTPGLLVLDTATHQERKLFEVPCGQPQAVAVVDQSFLVAGDNGILCRLDAATGTVLGSAPVGSKPTSIAVDANRVYVVNSGSGDLSVLTYPDLKPAGRLRVGTSPRKVAVHGNRVAVSLNGTNQVALLDSNGPTLLSTPEVGAGPVGLAFSRDGSLLYVACREGGTVAVLDGRTGVLQYSTTPQPLSAPFGLAVHP
ncbi:hypothetical protein DYH09_22515 [bacterium CPR1]|nr:hypothetical protein [bacterium CPR1]